MVWLTQSPDKHNSITILLKYNSHPAELHIRNSFFKFYFSQCMFQFLKIKYKFRKPLCKHKFQNNQTLGMRMLFLFGLNIQWQYNSKILRYKCYTKVTSRILVPGLTTSISIRARTREAQSPLTMWTMEANIANWCLFSIWQSKPKSRKLSRTKKKTKSFYIFVVKVDHNYSDWIG